MGRADNVLGKHRATIAPELIGKVTPTHYDARTGRLDLQPTSPAYATQLRLLGRQLIARINGKIGSTLVRDLRVLPPRALTATCPDQQAEHHPAFEQPKAPVRTRADATAGYHRALAEIRHTVTVTDPAVAMARQEQAILNRREPESAFAEAVAAQAQQDEAAARTAAATSNQAIAVQRARHDKAIRNGAAIPLCLARRPAPRIGAA
jgi:hypothetical protein